MNGSDTTSFPVYALSALATNNWRLQFSDADGLMLNMSSFEIIDFGAISYREIFQNVKTVLSTIVGSAALERTLGVDQDIVDRPINRADDAVIAVYTALYFWEPRAKVVSLTFDTDVINGHLTCNLQLQVSNVIFGTALAYSQSNYFAEPMKVLQGLPPMQQPVLIPGPQGPAGARGSLWYTGTTDPNLATLPATVQPNDMYLNTTTGDVWQLVSDGTTSTGLRAERTTLK